jgi:tetratricopeptide (TPR) repeat protein
MSMNRHYDDETLLEFVEGTSALSEEIATHAASCPDCASEIDSHREMIEVMKEPTVWNRKPVEPVTPPAERLARLTSFKQRLDGEDAAAKELVSTLLKGPSAWWRNAVRQNSAGRTAGMVRQLLAKMRELYARAPADALVVTSLANELANGLSIKDYPSDYVITLRAQTLRDHAYVLSIIGRYPDAESAVEQAERLIKQTPVPDYELARLDLVRAEIYRITERVPQAKEAAARAARTFRRFGDRPAWVNAQVYTGAVFFRNNDFTEALAIFQSIEHEAESLGDLGRLTLIHNMGVCHRELGNIERSIQCLSAAAAEYDFLGLEARRATSRWAIATTLQHAGKYNEAAAAMRTAWRDLESLGMETDAALAGLELAEILLAINQPSEVPHICRTLLDRFTRAGMNERALTALAFLRETIASGHVTPLHVRHVHDFLRDVPDDRERLVAPMPTGPLEG